MCITDLASTFDPVTQWMKYPSLSNRRFNSIHCVVDPSSGNVPAIPIESWHTLRHVNYAICTGDIDNDSI